MLGGREFVCMERMSLSHLCWISEVRGRIPSKPAKSLFKPLMQKQKNGCIERFMLNRNN